jgi:hypothetical protein
MVFALLFCLLGQWTHSLGIVIPVVAGVRLLVGAGSRWRGALLLGGGAMALALLFQMVPRFFLGADYEKIIHFDLFQVARGAIDVLSIVTIPSLWGQWGETDITLFPFLPWVMGALFLPFPLLWLQERRNAWILAPAAALFLPALVIPRLLGSHPGDFWLQDRYMYLPALALGIFLAVLLDAAPMPGKAFWRRVLSIFLAVLLLLFLVLNKRIVQIKMDIIPFVQDEYTRQVVEDYRNSLALVLASQECPTVVIIDNLIVRDFESVDASGTVNLWGVMHEDIHRFYFLGQKEIEKRVRFVKSPTEIPPGAGCIFEARAGHLRLLYETR